MKKWAILTTGVILIGSILTNPTLRDFKEYVPTAQQMLDAIPLSSSINGCDREVVMQRYRNYLVASAYHAHYRFYHSEYGVKKTRILTVQYLGIGKNFFRFSDYVTDPGVGATR